MRDALGVSNAGIRIKSKKVSNLKYAGDTTLLAETEEQLINILWKLYD